MKYLTGTKAQLATLRKALAVAAGLPIRGVTLGGPDNISRNYDESGAEIPGPGWTTDVVAEATDTGSVFALEISDEIEKHPALQKLIAGLKSEAALPLAVKTFLAKARVELP